MMKRATFKLFLRTTYRVVKKAYKADTCVISDRKFLSFACPRFPRD